MESYALLGITFLLFFVFMFMNVIEAASSYFGKKSKLNSVEDKYESLRRQRREMLVF
jgi:hypothetical protein